jgi:hypothetical protein
MTIERQDHDDAVYFVGPEVETSAAFSKKTLFVVGVRGIQQMIDLAREHNCPHIYLGANRSFQNNKLWAEIVPALLDEGFWVTLDYPASAQQFVVDTLPGKYAAHPHFIPMVSCIVPYVETFSKNLVLKVDDTDFQGTNTGVWCIPQHDLLDRNRFTPWVDYGNDEVIMRDSDIKALRKIRRNKPKED